MTERHTKTGAGGDISAFTRPSFVASAAMIVLLVIALVVVSVRMLWRDDSTTGTPTASVPASAPAPASVGASAGPADDSAGSVCGMPAGSQALPAGPLGAQRIDISPGLSVPDVEGVGPGASDPDTGITSCFAHSPRGAVVAAANFIKWLSSKRSWPETVVALTEDGDDQQRMVESITASWDGSTVSAVRVHGYRAVVRSADEVVVTLVVSIESDPSALVTWPLVMVWSEGDWKVRLPADDVWATQVLETDLVSAGFSQWSV